MKLRCAGAYCSVVRFDGEDLCECICQRSLERADSLARERRLEIARLRQCPRCVAKKRLLGGGGLSGKSSPLPNEREARRGA